MMILDDTIEKYVLVFRLGAKHGEFRVTDSLNIFAAIFQILFRIQLYTFCEVIININVNSLLL